MSISITKLAADVGVASGTLRFYERSGLLSPSGRSTAGYRLFDESVSERVRFIKDSQRAGLRLREIRELLHVRDEGACSCGHTIELVARRIEELDTEIARLATLRAELVVMQEQNEECRAAGPGAWPCEPRPVEVGAR
jgi:DNA-binding transcriptional MerR regulator